jgi:hypothetical protein
VSPARVTEGVFAVCCGHHLLINGLFEQALEQLVELMKDALEDRSDGSTSLVAGLHLERSL